MKYKIVGIANFLIGGIQILVALMLIFLVIPRMQSLYQDFNVQIPSIKPYLMPSLNTILGSLNIFLGYKLFSTETNDIDKYFTVSVIYLTFTFIIASVIAKLSILSLLIPLYKLTASLK